MITSAVRHNLPVQLTSFVGRHTEVSELGHLLARSRLITITGAGGSGKTRLALEVAAASGNDYSDGVYFVDLAALQDPSLVPQVIAATLGVHEQSDRFLITTLTEYLRPKKLLLVLDNCEHLAGACSSVSYTLLSAAADLRILATSRQPFNVTGETVWRLQGLSVPAHIVSLGPEGVANYEAVQLFIARAQLKRPDFALDADNAVAVAQVCNQTDGLPLAIEMAAARTRTLSVQEIARHLGQSIRLLTGDAVPAIPRHRTLAAALEWSYRLLTPQEQRLLRALSVFAGSFTLEAAHTLILPDGETPSQDGDTLEDTLELFTALVDKSMLNSEVRTEETRYRLLETVKQYAGTRAFAFDETALLNTKHLLFYLSLAEQAEPALQGSEQRAWLDRLEGEHDNLRKALLYAQTAGAHSQGATSIGMSEAALRMVKALWRFWYVRGYLTEGRQWSEAILATASSDPGVPPVLRAAVLAGIGLLANDQGDYQEADRLLNESLALFRSAGDKQGISNCLNYLGVLARNLGNLKEAAHFYEESLSLQRQLGSKPGVAACLNNLGYLAISLGDFPSARRFVAESLGVLSELNDPMRTAIVLTNLGRIACATGDYATAEQRLLESLSLRKELLDTKGIPNSLSALGITALYTLNYDEAASYLRQSLELYRELNDREAVAFVLNALGEVAHYAGTEEASQYFEQALSFATEIGNKVLCSNVLINIGQYQASKGDYAQAAASLVETLPLYLHTGAKVSLALSLMHIAYILKDSGEATRATRLLAYSTNLLEIGGFVLHKRAQEALDKAIAGLRLQLGKKAWQAMWAEGMAMARDDAVSEALNVIEIVQQQDSAQTRNVSLQRPPKTHDLTRREVEVLRALAEGLTDHQIAGRLFLTPNTVHSHLTRIYNKLNVPTRGAAVRFAVENGLT
jgi:predicted ATPase/DNA-binding CsgD family transcriptional regulator